MFDAGSLLNDGGLLLLFLIIYAHTGLFFCFFLPGGGLMFAAGVLIATGGFHYDLITVCGLLTLAALLGNLTGYWFGRKTGPLLYQRKDSGFFRKEHLKAAERFYQKYGALALTIGVSLPIIRTFAPIVAGMINMKFQRFLLLTTAGSLGYILFFTLSGYLIGSMPFLKPYLPYLVTGIILIVTIPVVIRIIRELRVKKEV